MQFSYAWIVNFVGAEAMIMLTYFILKFIFKKFGGKKKPRGNQKKNAKGDDY